MPSAALAHLLKRKGIIVPTGASAIDFYAPLINSLIPNKGIGSYTNTRNDADATFVDYEDKIIQVAANEARFPGLRRVSNHIPDSSDVSPTNTAFSWLFSIDGGAVAAPDSSLTARRITPHTIGILGWTCSSLHPIGSTALNSLWVRTNMSSLGFINGHNGGIADNITVTPNVWQRITADYAIVTATGAFGLSMSGLNPASDWIEVWHPQAETISGAINDNPSEYVDTNIDHGTGTNHSKYFTVTNPNEVTDNIITETVSSTAITGAPGYLTEANSENMVLQSEDFTTTWVDTWGSGVTVTADDTTAPNGETTADKIARDGSSGDAVNQIISLATDTKYFLSLYVKNVDANQSRLHLWDNTAAASAGYVQINWSGTTPTLPGGSPAGARIVALIDDWYRVEVPFTTTNTGDHRFLFMPQSTGGAGWNGSSVYVWGAQLETEAVSSYIPTTTASVVRARDYTGYDFANLNVNEGSMTLTVTPHVDVTDFSGNCRVIKGDSAEYEAIIGLSNTTGKYFIDSDDTLNASSTVDATPHITVSIAVTWSVTAGTISISVDGETPVEVSGFIGFDYTEFNIGDGLFSGTVRGID